MINGLYNHFQLELKSPTAYVRWGKPPDSKKCAAHQI